MEYSEPPSKTCERAWEVEALRMKVGRESGGEHRLLTWIMDRGRLNCSLYRGLKLRNETPAAQYSRVVTMPGWGTGYLPLASAINGAGESMVNLSTSGAISCSQFSIWSKVISRPV